MTLHFDAACRLTSATDDARRLFGVPSVQDLLGRTPWDVHPAAENSPLHLVMLDVQRTQKPHVVRAPSAIVPGADLWVRVSPIPGGGLRMAGRIVPARRRKARRVAVQKLSGVLMPLALALKPFAMSV